MVRRRRPARPLRAATLSAPLGRVIRERRDALEMTQMELAEASGLHVVAISRVERGNTPSLATIEALAAGLGVRASELLRRAEELTNTPFQG